MKIKAIAILLVGLAAVGSSAELVGSLLTAAGEDVYSDQQSIGPLATRTSDGDLNTRGVVEGSISLMAGDVLGAGDYVGMDMVTWSANTQYKDTVRYGGHTSLIAFDFDFSTYLATHTPGFAEGEFVYSLDLDYGLRRAIGSDAVFYLSYNKTGGGLLLDTTDILLLNPVGGTAQAALVADSSRYVSVGTLAANVVADTVSFDITSLVSDSADGKFRLVLANPEYSADIKLQNRSGIVATPVILETSSLWTQFVDAKTNGIEPILPDYSHAGYALGETGIPAAQAAVFNVANFGAVASDGLSDRVAIEAAILAAETHGGGIVFFPPGVFHVNESVGTVSGIEIHGEHIVLQGSGSGPGGTEIFMRENMNNETMFAFSPVAYPLKNRTTIVEDSDRETFSITVANASALLPEMLLELTMNNTNANAEFLDGLEPWDIWSTTVTNGVLVRGERHRIKSIDGNVVTFYEPIHCNILAAHGWTVRSSALARGWGVEDIHFRGNFQDTFVHHLNDTHDYGWQFLSFFYGESPYLRRCRFSDCSSAASVAACYAGTILNCSIEGNQGHSSFSSAYYSYGTLMAYCADMVSNGAFHGFAANAGSVGTVITRCKNSNRGFDWHASWPYCTLLDACSGGLIGNGGSYLVLPNHMRHLTLWNFNQTAGTVYNQYDWWEPRVGTEEYSGAKVVNPIIVGYHGLGTTFLPESCQLIESQGTPVAPDSLYESQLKLRLGVLPAWVDEARARYDLFMENGYWSQKPYSQLIYEEWMSGHGLSGSDGEYADDPDGDLRSNLAEYAVGGIPTSGSNRPTELPNIGMVEDGGFQWLEYIHARRRNAAALGLGYAVELTDDLPAHSWTTVGVAETGAALIDDDFESVTNRVSINGATNGFVRLKVEISD